jgi:hypothetical protein
VKEEERAPPRSLFRSNSLPPLFHSPPFGNIYTPLPSHISSTWCEFSPAVNPNSPAARRYSEGWGRNFAAEAHSGGERIGKTRGLPKAGMHTPARRARSASTPLPLMLLLPPPPAAAAVAES